MPKSIDIDAKHAEFMRASIRVIAQQGLAAASMRKISAAAGCTTGALTHYFPTREELLLRTLCQIHEQAGRRMLAAMHDESTAWGKLISVLRVSLPLDRERHEEWRVSLAFWSACIDDVALRSEMQRRNHVWYDMVENLLQPLIPSSRSAIEARRLVALIDGLGVTVAREQPSGPALPRAQQDCELMLLHHIESIVSLTL